MLKIKDYFNKIPSVVFVFLFVVLYRLPNLGLDLINNDDGWWKSRGYAYSSAVTSLDFAQTAQTYHPGVTLLWSQFIAIKAYGVIYDLGFTPDYFNVSEYILNHILQNLFVVLTTSVLLSILYLGLTKIFGKFYSILFIIILASEPFFTALGRTIHLDALLAISMFACFVYYYLALDENSKNKKLNLVLGGALGGVALLTKSPALFLIPMLFVPVLLSKNISELERKLIIYTKTLLIMFAIFFLLWPAMWVMPLEVLNNYLFKGVQGVGIEEGHQHYWFGTITSDPGWFFYPLVIIGRYSSVLFITTIGGALYLFKKKKDIFKDQLAQFSFMNLVYFACFVLMISLASKKIDRYSLPVIFPMIVLSLYFLKNLNLSRQKIKFIFGIYIAWAVITYSNLYSYYLLYASPLIGGYESALKLIEPGWPVAYAKLAQYFNDKENATNLKVALVDHFYIRGYANFKTIDIGDEKERSSADYIVLPSYRDNLIESYNKTMKLTYEADIWIAGVKIYTIYKHEKI